MALDHENSQEITNNSVRKSTRKQTIDLKLKINDSKILSELGFIKRWTYDLAIRDSWTEDEFSLEKHVLRSRYSVTRTKNCSTANLSNDELLDYIHENSFTDYFNT